MFLSYHRRNICRIFFYLIRHNLDENLLTGSQPILATLGAVLHSGIAVTDIGAAKHRLTVFKMVYIHILIKIEEYLTASLGVGGVVDKHYIFIARLINKISQNKGMMHNIGLDGIEHVVGLKVGSLPYA